jgi:hypothetical protein
MATAKTTTSNGAQEGSSPPLPEAEEAAPAAGGNGAAPPGNRFADAAGEEPAEPPRRKSVFEDLDEHKLDEDDEDETGPEEISSVPVKRLPRKDFIRFHPDPAYRFTAYIYEAEDDDNQKRGEACYVDPPIRQALKDLDIPLKKVVLVPYMNRRGSIFFWALTTTDMGSWHASGMRIVRIGRERWIRVSSKMDISSYVHRPAKRDYGDPEWPSLTLNEMLRLAFPPSRYIDSLNHDAVKDIAHG